MLSNPLNDNTFSDLVLHFRTEIEVAKNTREEIILRLGRAELRWTKPEESLRNCLLLLLKGGREFELRDLWMQDPSASLFEFHYFLLNLKKQGLLCYRLQSQEPIATLIPALFEEIVAPLEPLDFFKWPSTSHLRSFCGSWIAESTLSLCKVIVHQPQFIQVILALTKAKTAEQISTEMKSLPKKSLFSFLTLLQTASLFEEENGPKKLSELNECLTKATNLCYQEATK